MNNLTFIKVKFNSNVYKAIFLSIIIIRENVIIDSLNFLIFMNKISYFYIIINIKYYNYYFLLFSLIYLLIY